MICRCGDGLVSVIHFLNRHYQLLHKNLNFPFVSEEIELAIQLTHSYSLRIEHVSAHVLERESSRRRSICVAPRSTIRTK